MPKLYKFKWDNVTMETYRRNAGTRADNLRIEANILRAKADQIVVDADEICSQLLVDECFG